ncbi:MAG TPA: hypothetical protein VGJ70_18460, partial [Solirubrobacteraceae bacterium]
MDLFVPLRSAGRVVLAHQVDVGVGAQIVGHESQHRLGFLDQTRHDQVADDQSAPRQALVVEYEVADLPAHLPDVPRGDLEVLPLAEVAARQFARRQLEIRHVDAYHAIHQPQAVRAVVGARVVDDREPQAFLHGQRECLEDLRHDVLGCHPVDVVAADLLQLQHHRREPSGVGLVSLHLPGHVEVLAEDAAQVAAAEEDRSRAAPAAQAVLFAEVREVRRDRRPAADFAEPALVGQSVDRALARADPARSAEQL